MTITEADSCYLDWLVYVSRYSTLYSRFNEEVINK